MFLAHDVQESYENFKTNWTVLELNFIQFELSSDLNIQNFACGFKNHASKNPYAYCPATEDKDSGIFNHNELRTFSLIVNTASLDLVAIKADCNLILRRQNVASYMKELQF